MKVLSKKTHMLFLIMIIVMCFGVSLFYMDSMDKVDKIYHTNVENSMLDSKEIYLRDSVNNLIKEIEASRQTHITQLTSAINRLKSFIAENESEDETTFLRLCETLFYFGKEESQLTVWIKNKETGRLMYFNSYKQTHHAYEADILFTEQADDYLLTDSYTGTRYEAQFGISKTAVYDMVYNEVHSRIHSSMYSDGTYFWINEVVNYKGGDNYAIRFVHPNLPETEGSFLSTNTPDIKGDFPYKEELDGINEAGETLYTYYFKKMSSNVLSEKLTFAKLDPEYNWIVCMGVHLDDVKALADSAIEANKNKTLDLTVKTTILVIILLMVAVLFFAFSEKWYYKLTNRQLMEKIRLDALTSALSRRAAIDDFSEWFTGYKNGEQNISLFMFDIDNFKNVNDTYGHETGDFILKDIVNAVKTCVRETDSIYRWGGEEFFLVCKGMGDETAKRIAQKILDAVEKFPHPCFKDISDAELITISIGIATFHGNDNSYMDAVNRADAALYISKRTGKNKWTSEADVHAEV